MEYSTYGSDWFVSEFYNCRYVVVATEYLTRWAEVKGISNKDAVTVADFVLELIYRYGVMEIMQTDQGREFCNILNE